jgi:hypothetical protein
MSVSSHARTAARRGVAAAVGIATAVALAAALLVYGVAGLTGADLVVAPPGQPTGTVNAVSVIVITLVSGVGALLLAVLLARLAPRRARVVFLVLALTVFAVSMVGPLGAAQRTSTAVWLTVMHLVVAAVIIPLTMRALPGPRTTSYSRSSRRPA